MTTTTYTPWGCTHDVEELAEGVLEGLDAQPRRAGSSAGIGGTRCPPQSGTPFSPRPSPTRTARNPWSGRFLAWATTGRGGWRSGSQNTSSGTLPPFDISARKGAGHDHEDKDQAPQPAQHDDEAEHRVRQPLRQPSRRTRTASPSRSSAGLGRAVASRTGSPSWPAASSRCTCTGELR